MDGCHAMEGQIKLGDPVPWFDAKTIAGTSINLGVVAGRWVALCFLNSLDREAEATRALAELLGEAHLFNDDHLVFYGVLTETHSKEAGQAGPPSAIKRLVLSPIMPAI